MKDLIKNTLISIGIALTMLCLWLSIIDLSFGGVTFGSGSLAKMVGASIVIGFGFGMPTVVYSFERIPQVLQSVIQMGIGFAVMVAVTATGVWGTRALSAVAFISILVIQLLLGLAIWAIFMWHNYREAKRINDIVQSQN